MTRITMIANDGPWKIGEGEEFLSVLYQSDMSSHICSPYNFFKAYTFGMITMYFCGTPFMIDI